MKFVLTGASRPAPSRGVPNFKKFLDHHRRHNSEIAAYKGVRPIMLPAAHGRRCPRPKPRELKPIFGLHCILRHNCIHAKVIVEPRVTTGQCVGKETNQSRRGCERLREGRIQLCPTLQDVIDHL
ncbi:exo-alpha-sialidase [Trypanosoma cruzi]|nr:exo-alpha-sialidase [Trypanosoma cruzi]